MSDTIVVRMAQRKSLCQFSKKIIQPDTLLTLFTEDQYNYFKTKIKEHLSQLPDVIIDIIIDKTNYEYYINQWGILEYVDWMEDSNWQGFQFLGHEDSEDDIDQFV